MAMKFFKFLVLVLALKPSSGFGVGEKLEKFSDFTQAIYETTVKVNRNGAMTLNVITSSDTNGFKTRDFVNELMAKLFKDADAPSRHECSNGIKKLLNRKKYFVAFPVENFQEFLNIFKKIDNDMFTFNGFFYVVLIDGKIPEIQEIFELFWKIQVYNVNVMFEENGEVLVKTFMPFTPRSCSDTSPVTITKFKDGKFLFLEEFFPKKFRNLYNCPIRIALILNNEPYVISLPNKTSELFGRDVEIVRALAEKLNFKSVKFIFETEYFSKGDKSVNTLLKSVLDRKTDIAISNLWLRSDRLRIFDASHSYATDKLIFVVPPGAKFTALEKLIYPYKLTSWIFIVLVFVIGMIVIRVVKVQSKKVQDFVFGTGVKTPSVYLISAFFGESLRKLPKRNFARFLLMMFLIYSLVIRTVYQGSFYKLMKSNKRHKEVQTIEEMIEKDFTFYVYLGDEDVFGVTKELRERLLPLPYCEMQEKHDLIDQNPDSRACYEQSMLSAFYWNQNHYLQDQKRICKEVFMFRPEVIYMKKDFFLLEEINNKLNFLVNSGLIDFWSYQYIDKNKLRTKEVIGPKVLKLNHFQGSFGVLILGIIISIYAFLGETLY